MTIKTIVAALLMAACLSACQVTDYSYSAAPTQARDGNGRP